MHFIILHAILMNLFPRGLQIAVLSKKAYPRESQRLSGYSVMSAVFRSTMKNMRSVIK
jgi:hypothetical protein